MPVGSEKNSRMPPAVSANVRAFPNGSDHVPAKRWFRARESIIAVTAQFPCPWVSQAKWG